MRAGTGCMMGKPIIESKTRGGLFLLDLWWNRHWLQKSAGAVRTNRSRPKPEMIPVDIVFVA